MWRFLKKLETELPYDPAIPLLGIHSEERITQMLPILETESSKKLLNGNINQRNKK